MVSDNLGVVIKHLIATVLILVLMEYGLWQKTCKAYDKVGKVLILVLMEYGLWPFRVVTITTAHSRVLILVLMEYGLWHMKAALERWVKMS